MPASYTPQQKAAIAQFVGFTSTKDSVAAKQLKSHGWNIEQAVDAILYPARSKAISRKGGKMSLSKEKQVEIVKRQCKEQKRGDWAKKKKTWYDKALALGFFRKDKRNIRAILEEAEAKGEYLPLLDNETPFGVLADEFERVLLPSYFQSKNSEAEGLDGVLREISEEEEEIFNSESSLISTKKLFRSLIKEAGDKNSWIKEKDLPLYLRFAIKRPLMSELKFCRALEILDLTLDSERGEAMSPIDNGPTGLASKESEEDDARQFRGNYQALMNVYGLVQDGMVDSEEAYQHYRAILGYTDVDKETLIASLQNYGIPVERTPSPGRAAAREPAVQNHPSTQTTTFKSLEQKLPIDEGSMQIIEELSNLIMLYRSRHVTLTEVIKLIYECLEPIQPKKGVIKDYVKGSRPPDDAAHNLWEEAVELNSDENDDDDDDDDDGDDDNDDEEDGAASSGDEGSKPNQGGESHSKTNLPESEALNGHDNKRSLDSTNGKSMVPGSPMGPSARLLQTPRSPARDTGTRGPRQGTPILDAIAPATGGSESRGRRSSTRIKARMSSVAASSSRDPIHYVQTGSRMPTKQARRLAYNLGLSYDYLRNRVRKRLARGGKKQAKRARLPVFPPKSKRKASDAAGQSKPRKAPRLRLFVKPRDTKEDSESTSLEGRDMTESKTPCSACLPHPCRCAAEPPSPLELEPMCSKCQQVSCTCIESVRSPNRGQKADADGSTHSAVVDFNDIGQYSGSPYPVLAYLSRIWEARDIFQSFIRVGFGNITEAMRKSADRVLAEIGLGIKLGEIEDCITKKDVMAVAVLQRLQGGSGEAALSSTKRDPAKSEPIRGAKITNSPHNKIPISEDSALTAQQAKEIESDANSDIKLASSDIAAYSDSASDAESLPFTLSNALSAIAGSQMLIETGKGILSGKLKSSRERNKIADAVLRHTKEALHEVVDCEEMRDQNSVAARNADSAGLPSNVDRSLSDFPEAGNAVNPSQIAESDPSPAQTDSPPSESHHDPKAMIFVPNGNSHPVMSHLSSIMKDPFILPRLTKLVEAAKVSRREVEWMRTLLESVQKGMRCGAIKSPWSKLDLSAVSTMQRLVREHSSESLQREKENTPPGGINFKPIPPKLPESNPVLAYLTRVLDNQKSEDSTLQFLRDLERNSMFEGTKGEVERIVGLFKQGIRSKEIERSEDQTWKDIDACEILDRLYSKCRPLHACGPHADIWSATEQYKADSTGTGNPEGPINSNSSSGAPAQDLGQGQRSSPSSDITRELEGESFGTNAQVESLEDSMKLTPSPNILRSPANESLLFSGTPVIPEAGHPESKGVTDSSTPPLTPQPRSYGIPTPPSTAAEANSWTSPYELSHPISPITKTSSWTSPYESARAISPFAESSSWKSPYESSRPKSPVAEASPQSPEPPASPRPRPRELRRPVDSIAGSCSESPEPPPTPDIFKDMTAADCFEYFQDVAAREQRSFSSVMAERRAIRQRPGEADYRYFSSFFQSSNGGAPNLAATLSKLFDKYRDNPKEEPDKIGVEGSMKYLGDLHVKLDEVVVLAVLTELNAPTMGEFSRGPFLDGWVKNRAETLSKQQAQVATWRRSLSTSPDFFKKVYKQTFILARQQGQRVLPLDVAIEYWRLLFTPPSLSWNTSSTPWLDWWIEYLEEKWAKSINKDMWDQTHNFMVKSREDETMNWWSEDGAWPGVLDDFVVYVKEKRGTPTETEMDIG